MSIGSWPEFKPAGDAGYKSTSESRARDRLKVSLPVHVRPFDSRFSEVEDVAQVLDFSRDGLYFTTSMPHYRLEMRLIVTFPFGAKILSRRTYLATVVRIEELENSCQGVALQFLL